MEGELMKAGINGVTSKTPDNIFFGAGTIHKNLKYTSSWNFESSIVGATNGGSKLSIAPELVDISVDGVTVPIKGLKKKVGETATLEVNFAELSLEIVKAATLGVVDSEATAPSGYTVIKSKEDLTEDDYWENVAFVGKTLKGKDIIAILENPLITNGFENEGKNKEGSVGAFTFTCHADLEDDELTTLPWKIYHPTASNL